MLFLICVSYLLDAFPDFLYVFYEKKPSYVVRSFLFFGIAVACIFMDNSIFSLNNRGAPLRIWKMEASNTNPEDFQTVSCLIIVGVKCKTGFVTKKLSKNTAANHMHAQTNLSSCQHVSMSMYHHIHI